jgi:hypothetical protein
MKPVHPAILCLGLRTGNVPSVAILTMPVGWNATVVNVPKMETIDYFIIPRISLSHRISAPFKIYQLALQSA